MRLNFKNALTAFSLLLVFTAFTSCQKEHDLVSSYVIKDNSQPILEDLAKVQKDSKTAEKVFHQKETEEVQDKTSK